MLATMIAADHGSPTTGLSAHFMEERGMLLRLLRARLGSVDEAEDVLQELWLRLRAAPSGPVAQPAAYLFRAASNLALDRRRGALRRVAREADWSALHMPAGAMPSAEVIAIQRQRLAAVDAAVAALPPRTAAIFRQHRYEGMPHRAIAEAAGISVSAVEKHLAAAYRAIHGLRDDVEPLASHADAG